MADAATLPRMTPRPQRAVVVGGSMAGLVAARVLSDHFDEVVVVDRDRFPLAPEGRAGTPQAFHVHILLGEGRARLSALLPGLDAALEAAGAPGFDYLESFAVFTAFGRLASVHSGVPMRMASRSLLELETRRLVLARPNVRALERVEVRGLECSPDGARVVAVKLAARTHEEGRDVPPETLAADLVVDASGRTSKAPEWLRALGVGEAPVRLVDGQLSYSTRWFTGVKLPADTRALLVGPRAPDVPRGAALFPVEGGRYVVTINGIGPASVAPTAEEAFVPFTRTLVHPAIHEALGPATAISGIRGYRGGANTWRQYHRLRGLPDRFLPMGDSLCAFNPIYGQGMTVAVREAQLLDAELRRRPGQIDGLSGRALRRFAGLLEEAWSFAVSEDYRYPTTMGPPVPLRVRLAQRYLEHVVSLSVSRPAVTRVFVRVIHGIEDPSKLLAPRVLLPVLWQMMRGTGARAELLRGVARGAR